MEHLKSRRASCYLFGGAAFSLLMRPIRTRDLDIALPNFPTDQQREAFSSSLEERLLDSGGEEVVRMTPLTKTGRRLTFSIAFKSGPGLSIELWEYVDERRPGLFPTQRKTLEGSPVRITTKESWIATKAGQPNNLEDRDIHRLALLCEKANIEDAFRIMAQADLLENASENLGYRLSRLGIPIPPTLNKLRRLVRERTAN